jgi:hypothetical protein
MFANRNIERFAGREPSSGTRASFLAKPDTDDTKRERGDIRAIQSACKTGVQNGIGTIRDQRRLT